MIDLSQFVDKNVRVTYGNGSLVEGKISKIDSANKPYLLFGDVCNTTYTKNGRYYYSLPKDAVCDIIHIEEIKPMTSIRQLQTKIEELESELQSFKQQLNNHKVPTLAEASVGDTLDDGSIVLQKSNGLALLVAPKSTDVIVSWSKEFSEVFDKLKDQGFNRSQWFIPTIDQLKLAYQLIPQEFSSTFYWSSTEYSATLAYYVNFITGNVGNSSKTYASCVRAFRCVTY